jgi:cell division GTPase FtsZ
MITNSNTVINIDFNDVDTTLRNGGAAVISIGYGEGEHRVTKAINDALNSPLLKDRDIFGSQRLLFNIYFNPDGDQEFLMKEASEISEFVSDINPNVDIIWGLAKDTSLGNKVKITILAAGFAFFQHEHVQARALAVDGGGKPGRTRANDDQFTLFHTVCSRATGGRCHTRRVAVTVAIC